MVSQFSTTAMIKMFLDSTFFTILIFLAILTSMLVLSLMISDVDKKTYEYGMLRALGFKKTHLMGMITINSFTFSIPGMCFGIMIAFILNILIRELVFKMSYNATSYELALSAIIIGVSFGFAMPIFANYYPIKEAMSKTLRDSLDLSKRTKDQFGVKI